jgi:hypothetical protein
MLPGGVASAPARTAADENVNGQREMPKVAEIQQLQIAAVLQAGNGRLEEAIQHAKKATEVEASLPSPVGPPILLKTSYELYGEVLLRAGRFDEAYHEFMTSLTRQPDRGRSLLRSRTGKIRGSVEDASELAEARKHSKAARN